MKTIVHPDHPQFAPAGIDFIGEDGEQIGVEIAVDGKKLWVNVNGQCVMRLSGITEIQIDDRRPEPIPNEF